MILARYYLCWMLMLDRLNAHWPAPSNVFALTTTRSGGISLPPYDSNNLALHVGDNEQLVLQNREHLIQTLNLPSAPEWLEQTHTNRCVVIEEEADRLADAAVTRKANTVLAIMTADCLPIVLTNQNGTEVGAIHAGWRGLANGIIESTLNQMHSKASELLAWIGPAICQHCYETGDEVRSVFTHQYPFTQSCFQHQQQRLYANLPKIAEMVLKHHGVKQVYQSKECTFEAKSESNNRNKYYSYRHEKQTGRIATLIWINDPQ